MNIKTHQKINSKYCGVPIELEENYSRVKLKMLKNMIVDETGLIHGGFIFSLADYAAMLAINHPNVVLGGASVKFLHPIKEGDTLIAAAQLKDIQGKKHIVEVKIQMNKQEVFIGEFYCYILEKNLLLQR